MEFTVIAAQQQAQTGRLEAWIHAYLNTGYWANPGLSEGLKLQQRWWRGPLEVNLADLVRCCGPEPDLEFCIDPEGWEQKINELMSGIREPMEVPPLIVQYRQGELSIRDGNHRHEALRRQGRLRCWVLIWYDSLEDFRADKDRWESSS